MAYLGYSVTYIHIYSCTVDICNLCDMSVSNTLVTPIHNGATCVNMVICFKDWCMIFLKDAVEVNQNFG